MVASQPRGWATTCPFKLVQAWLGEMGALAGPGFRCVARASVPCGRWSTEAWTGEQRARTPRAERSRKQTHHKNHILQRTKTKLLKLELDATKPNSLSLGPSSLTLSITRSPDHRSKIFIFFIFFIDFHRFSQIFIGFHKVLIGSHRFS